MIHKLVALAVVLVLALGLFLVYEGYQIYEQAVEETPVQQVMEQIQSQPHYTLLMYNSKISSLSYNFSISRTINTSAILRVSSFFCVIPNAPSVYALTVNEELARQRQKQVIQDMITWGYLTKDEAAALAQ